MIRQHDQGGVVLEVPRNHEKNSPSSCTWHQKDELPRFLDGNEIVDPGYEKDAQRGDFYSAEILFYRRVEEVKGYENTIGDLRDVANFISEIWSTKWWQRRYKKLEVYIKGHGDEGLATATFGGDLLLPDDTRNPLSILHEIIHFTTPKPHAGHGRLFCARFKEIVGFYWGKEVEKELKEVYELKGVNWQPRHCT